MDVQAGSILIHPIHGEMAVFALTPNAPDLNIDGEWRTGGQTIHAKFDKLIPQVRWRHQEANGTYVSKLIFHSYYLCKLKIK